MIWIWIALAVLLTWVVSNKHLAWYHYIWMFLPIEMYGISIAGATLKPYMILGIIIILNGYIKKENIKFPVTFLLLIAALSLSDLVNMLVISSIMQHLMFVFVVIIAFSYLKQQKDGIELEAISDITIATTIGYGIVFSAAGILFNIGIQNYDIFTADRYSAGMILKFVSTGGMFTTRLRGFCIDPNSVYTTLIPGAAFASANILYLRKNKLKSLIAIFLYINVVYQSGSRMGFLCSVIMIAVMFVGGYRETEKKREWTIIAIVLIGTLSLLLFIRGGKIINEFVADIVGFFSSRASLFDDAGRLTIWINNIRYLVDNNRILIGVGQNQIYKLTLAGKECHNTWLEWICGTGIILGLGMSFWFFFASRKLKRKCLDLNVDYMHYYFPIVFAYWTILIAVTTVDNITNSVMIFLMVIFRYGMPSKQSFDNKEDFE